MVQVTQSTVIDAPIDEVWRILRDFNGHESWHPAVATSVIEGGARVDAVGSVRRFRLRDGGEFREQLLSLSDAKRTLTYCLLEAPVPLMGYVATIRLKPVTDGDRTFWEWRSEFSPPATRRDELMRLVSDDIYNAGFAAVRGILTRSRPGPGNLGPGAGQAILVPDASSAPTSVDASRALPSVAPPRSADATTKAIVVERHGGPEVLQWRDVHLPPPGPGEVRIRHTFVGVNFIDIYSRNGQFDLLRPPAVPGMEAAGLIEAVGRDVAGFAPGDRVAYACPPVGAYAERRNMAPELLVSLSADISDEMAAASLLKGVTASFLLHDVYPLKPRDIILVHAAAGGVGQLLVQWAKHLGATVLATVSSEEKARIVERRGADHVIIYSRESFAEAVMRFTDGRGADAVYDAVGADTFAGSLAALATRGSLVSFGQASGPVGDWDVGRLASKSITISRPNYAHYTDTPEKLGPHVSRFFAAVRQGIVTVDPPKHYPLARAAEAHRDLEQRRTTGSLVLTV